MYIMNPGPYAEAKLDAVFCLQSSTYAYGPGAKLCVFSLAVQKYNPKVGNFHLKRVVLHLGVARKSRALIIRTP